MNFGRLLGTILLLLTVIVSAQDYPRDDYFSKKAIKELYSSEKVKDNQEKVVKFLDIIKEQGVKLLSDSEFQKKVNEIQSQDSQVDVKEDLSIFYEKNISVSQLIERL